MADKQVLTVSCGPADYDPSLIGIEIAEFPDDFRYHVKQAPGGRFFAIEKPDGTVLGMFLTANSPEEAIGRFVMSRGGAGCFNIEAVESDGAKVERLTAWIHRLEEICHEHGFDKPQESDIKLSDLLKKIGESSSTDITD